MATLSPVKKFFLISILSGGIVDVATAKEGEMVSEEFAQIAESIPWYSWRDSGLDTVVEFSCGCVDRTVIKDWSGVDDSAAVIIFPPDPNGITRRQHVLSNVRETLKAAFLLLGDLADLDPEKYAAPLFTAGIRLAFDGSPEDRRTGEELVKTLSRLSAIGGPAARGIEDAIKDVGSHAVHQYVGTVFPAKKSIGIASGVRLRTKRH